MNYTDIINFWFKEIPEDKHFKKDPELDKTIKKRFLETYGEIVRGEHEDWRIAADGRLAEIIVLDQFSRNMFRDERQAFIYDPLALALAQEAVRQGYDLKLDKTKRHFLYMPYMHSESKKVHKEALRLFKKLGNKDALEYEKDHKKIIDIFGRYPHRNQILGRKSTPQEKEFLKTHKEF